VYDDYDFLMEAYDDRFEREAWMDDCEYDDYEYDEDDDDL